MSFTLCSFMFCVPFHCVIFYTVYYFDSAYGSNIDPLLSYFFSVTKIGLNVNHVFIAFYHTG